MSDIQPIAMWSGPRNISTAMMYAFASRSDCDVWDEPFYAWYLSETGLEHPMGDKVMAAGECDAARVIARCRRAGPRLHYQKHMTQHMLPLLDRGWIKEVRNAFLIRAPEKVVASYAAKRADVTFEDIGFVQQLEIFRQVGEATGVVPPVVDADRFLQDPEAGLQNLCEALGIGFEASMLSWPQGPKPFDGVWAAHWYGNAWKSTGFGVPGGPLPTLSDELADLAQAARPCYEALLDHAL